MQLKPSDLMGKPTDWYNCETHRVKEVSGLEIGPMTATCVLLKPNANLSSLRKMMVSSGWDGMILCPTSKMLVSAKFTETTSGTGLSLSPKPPTGRLCILWESPQSSQETTSSPSIKLTKESLMLNMPKSESQLQNCRTESTFVLANTATAKVFLLTLKRHQTLFMWP